MKKVNSSQRSASAAAAAVAAPVIDDRKPDRRVYEITLRIPRALVSRLEKCVFLVLLIYAALVVAPLAFRIPDVGLDNSWMLALNLLPHSHYKFGTDVVFTYGPLGFVETPENIGANLPIALLFRLLIWGLLIGQLGYWYFEGVSRRAACFFGLSSIILVHSFLSTFLDYMVAAAAFLIVLRRTPDKQSWRAATALAFLTSFAFLSKQSGYVMILLSLCAYFALWRFRDHEAPPRGAWLKLALIAGAPFIAYLAYNPSVSGLWAYITGMLQVSGGYSTAMSFAGLPKSAGLQLALLAALMVGFAALAIWRKWLALEAAACILLAFCFAMKHSVIRTDGHITFVFALSVILMGLLSMCCRYTKAALLTGGLAFASVAILSATEMDPTWGITKPLYWSLAPHVNEFTDMFHWDKTIAAASAQAEANLRSDQLPDSFIRRIGQAPVVLFPNELAYAPANQLNMLPIYTLQAYVAFTPELDLRTAQHLQATPANTRLLMTWATLDYRHMLLDSPASWQTIYEDFQPEASESNLILLSKRSHRLKFHPRPLKTVVADIREWQDVPEREFAVGASIEFSPTVLGKVRNLLYKIDPIYIELEPDIGSPQRFRVIPSQLRHSFVINCLPLNPLALEDILFQNNCQQKVKRFRFSGDGLDSFSARALISFTETPDEKFQFAPREDAGPRESEISTDVGTFWEGSVDSVMAPGYAPPTAANPIRVPPGKRLEISGWAVPPGRTETFQAVYAILGKWQFRALTTLRPDVAQYLKKPGLAKCGFEISADASSMAKGVYPLRLVGVAHGTYYQCPNRLYVRIE